MLLEINKKISISEFVDIHKKPYRKYRSTHTQRERDSWCISRLQIKGLSTQKGALLLHYRFHSIIRESSELQINSTAIHVHVINFFFNTRPITLAIEI